MKNYRLLFIMMAAVMFAVSCSEDDASVEDLSAKKATFLSNERWMELDFCNVQTHELIGGQDILMGSVIVGNTKDSLYVKYQANDGYVITETHLFVGDVMGKDFPKTKKENPKIGHFPYSTEDFGSSTIVMYSIGLNELDPELGNCFDVAAHAVVECLDGNCEETAWGAGKIVNEFVYAAKAQISIPEVGSVAAYGPGIFYADECHWGNYFGYNILDVANFSPVTLPLLRYTGDELGNVDITIENDSLVFRFTGKDSNTIDHSYLFVGELNDLFSYSEGSVCPDYVSFPYQESEVKIALTEFKNEEISTALELAGTRWGFYIQYCANCE